MKTKKFFSNHYSFTAFLILVILLFYSFATILGGLVFTPANAATDYWTNQNHIEEPQNTQTISGTQYTVIEKEEHLAYLIKNFDSETNYILAKHLDMSAYEWTPIGYGNTIKAYNGEFHGNGWIITGLNSSVAQKITYNGLFAKLQDATVTNVTLSNCSLTSEAYLGGISATTAGNSTIQKCLIVNPEFTVDYASTTTYLGGIVGKASGTITINNCIVEQGELKIIEYNPTIAYAGGIIGYATQSSQITECSNYANVTIGEFEKCYAGGICGVGDASYCANHGDITSSNYYYFTNNYGSSGPIGGKPIGGGSTGSVVYKTLYHPDTSYSCAGGISGQIYSSVSYCYNFGNVAAYSAINTDAANEISTHFVTPGIGSQLITSSNSVSVDKLTKNSSSYAGGIIGDVTSSSWTLSNCYNTGYVYNADNETVYTGSIGGHSFSIGYHAKSSYFVGCSNSNFASSKITNCYMLNTITQATKSKLIYGPQITILNSEYTSYSAFSNGSQVGISKTVNKKKTTTSGYNPSQYTRTITEYCLNVPTPNDTIVTVAELKDLSNLTFSNNEEWAVDPTCINNDGFPYLKALYHS